MKKISLLFISLTTLVLLTACAGPQKSAAKPTASGRTSLKARSKSSTKAAVKSKQQATATKMNFKEIQLGDYRSLQGSWTEFGRVVNKQDGNGPQVVAGGGDTLLIAKNKITNNNDMTLQETTLLDNAGTHAVEFKVAKQALEMSLADDAGAAVNWSVTFYPTGTTSEYKNDASSAKNTQDLIVIWNSGNSYTQVFAKNAAGTAVHYNKSALNLSELAVNNFASLVGTWRKIDGSTIVVTNQTETRPTDNDSSVAKGAVIKGSAKNGYNQVIGSGAITDGYMVGAMETFDPTIKMSAFSPLTIIPKGVQASADDDSDKSKDRLIVGGGQGGYATSAYYRQ